MNKTIRIGLGLALALSVSGALNTAHARAEIDAAAASRIALDRIPGRVDEVDREHEGGRVIFEVDVLGVDGIKYEVRIDASDGLVLSVKPD